MDERVGPSADRITAVFTQGKLLLAATGTKEGPHDQVFFEPESQFGVPPSFVLRQRQSPGSSSLNVPTPYQVAMLFAVGSPPDEVIVRSESGELRLPVLVAADVEALERRETVPLVRMTPSRLVDGRARIPAPFEEMLAENGEDVRTPLLWPLQLGPLFEGRLEPAAADPRRAIGYSDKFDFTEAFLNALRSLPPDHRGGTDTLTTVHVTGTGALLGGLGGGQRMFVSILAY